MNYKLSITGRQYKQLKKHLFCGDGLEAVALLLCHLSSSEQEIKFVGYKIILVEYSDCTSRSKTHISWNTNKYLSSDKIENMDKSGVSIVTIHGHPTGFKDFSKIDNDNDKKFFSSVFNWFDDKRPHGSVIMLPNGDMFGRVFDGLDDPVELSSIMVSGSRIKIFTPFNSKNIDNKNNNTEHEIRVKQAFGLGTYQTLKNIRAGIVGCSGTGSIVVEMLARNCIGNLAIIDPDTIEEKNLNRILNSTKTDAKESKSKVSTTKEAIVRIGFNTKINALKQHTSNPNAIDALKNCDIIFGCVDSALGRYHLDCISSAYYIPYFDVGVQLYADKNGKIGQAIMVAHYIQPGESSLLSRGAYTSRQVTAESMKMNDPERYEKELKNGYILNVPEDEPAVISVNMQAACMSVNDFLARIHGYRLDDDNEFDIQKMSLTHGFYQHKRDNNGIHPMFAKDSGKADRSTLIKLIR